MESTLEPSGPTVQTPHFLTHGGETGLLIAVHNWKDSILGEISKWPHHLTTSLNIVLGLNEPAMLLWGSRQICFYNDKYRQLGLYCGLNNLAIGDEGSEIFASTLPKFDHHLEKVYAGNNSIETNFSFKAIVHGKTSELLFKLNFNAVFGENDTIAGILVIFSENQDQKIANNVSASAVLSSEHQLRSVVESAPFPIGVYIGRELRIAFANKSIKDIWGKGDDLEGRLYTEVLPELGDQEIFGQLTSVFDTGVPFHANNSRVDLLINGSLQTFYFNYSFTPLYDQYGKIYGVMNTAADVTALNLAKQEVEASEFRLRKIMEESPIATSLLTGPEMIVEIANEKMIDVWGKDTSIIGMPLKDAVPELIGQPFLDLLSEIYQTGIPYSAVDAKVNLVVNGKLQTFYFDFTYHPLSDANGNIYGIVDTAVDVTERFLARQKIEQSERQFLNSILQAPVAMCLLKGPNQIVEIANERMLELWGTTRSIIGQSIYEGLPVIIEQGFKTLLTDVFQSGKMYKAYEVPVNLPRANGLETFYIDFVYEAFREANGEIIGIVAVATDVTAKFLSRKTIEAAEEKARLAIESADLGAYDVNLLTDEIHTSERFNAIWGVRKDVPRSVLAEQIHPDDRLLRQEAHKIAFKTGNLHYETRVLNGTDKVRWVKVKGKVIFSEDGTPLSILGVIQDITEQKMFAEQLTKKVKEQTIELHRSNEDLLHFAHVASHDLKEPVRKIKVFTNLIEEQFGKLLPQQGMAYLNKVQNATDRMFSMIDGVLSYSALNASEQPIGQVDLNASFANIESDLEVLLQQKQGKIEIENVLPTVTGAEVLIHQLFYNLVNNALKFSRQDVAPVIKVSGEIIRNEGVDYACIVVSDNGIGIDPQFYSQIFSPFSRLNSKDKFEGTGLGLALCKKIVERHHGSISATGDKDGGAKFYVTLPLVLKKNRL